MIIDLSNITFTNDFFSKMLPDGSMLVLNRLDENLFEDGKECTVKAISIEVQDYDGNIITCPCVIGLGNDLIKINTEYKEYEGKVLSPDNMAMCTIEVYE